jgi:NAD(P)H-quinone oxidoreductase subunit 6
MANSPGAIAVFYLFAAVTIAGAGWVAFSRKIVHSAFALLATFFGVAGLYAFLAADLVAVVQVLVYIGGILVLILFAVMLTSRIGSLRVSNPSLGTVPGLIICAVVAAISIIVAVRVFGHGTPAPAEATTAKIGHALLSTYVLPFEVISILLLAVLLGAVTLARGHQRDED